MPRKSDQRNRLRQQRAAAAATTTTTTTTDTQEKPESEEINADDGAEAPETQESIAAENAEIQRDDDADDDEIQGEAQRDDEETEATTTGVVEVEPAAKSTTPPPAAPVAAPAETKPTRSFADALSPMVKDTKNNTATAAAASGGGGGWSSWSSWVSSSVSAVSDMAASAIAETSKAIDSAFEDDAPAAAPVSDDNDAEPPAPKTMVTSEPANVAAASSVDAEENDADGVESLMGGFFGALESGASKLAQVTSSATKALPIDSVKSTGTRVAESLTAQLNELGTVADIDKVSKAASSVMDSSFSMLERVGARAFDLLTVRETQLDQPGERVAARFASSAAPVRSASSSGKAAEENKGAEFHSRFEEAMGPAHAEALERLSMHATLRTQRLLGALEAKARADAAKVQQALAHFFEEDEDDEKEDDDDNNSDAAKSAVAPLPAKAEASQVQLRERVAAAKTELAALVASIGTVLGDESATAEAIVANAKSLLRATLGVGVPAMASSAALATEVLLRTGESAMVDIEPDEPMPRDDVAPLRAQAQSAAQAAHALAASVQQLAGEVVAAGTAVRSAARARLAALDAAALAQQVDDAATATVKDAYLQAGRAVQHITSARQWLAPIFSTLAL
jgi:hypothetical protein